MASESEWNSRVRWSECDAAGIIYHAHVFDWFSEARIVWLADHELSYYEVLRARKIELLVKTANARFYHTLKPGDPIRLRVMAKDVSPTRVTFQYQVGAPSNPEVMALEGFTEHAFVVDNRAKRLDRTAPDILAHFERSL